jgi:hypothetical protein
MKIRCCICTKFVENEITPYHSKCLEDVIKSESEPDFDFSDQEEEAKSSPFEGRTKPVFYD